MRYEAAIKYFFWRYFQWLTIVNFIFKWTHVVF
jgi:hypothetical protein